MDCYAVLDVPPDATMATIRSAFRDLAHKWHPDKADESEFEANRRMSEINLAWEILKSPETRRLYDEARANGSSWLPIPQRDDAPWTPSQHDGVPRLTDVEFGCVRRFGYDGNSKLFIEFRSGGLYVYQGVPVALYAALVHSKSQSRFAIYNIVSGPYRCKRIGA